MSSQAAASQYLRGSVANMIRSMLVIAGITMVLVFAVARVNSISQPSVDVAASAMAVARESGWRIERPVGLPSGWKATSVRYVRGTDGLMTWHAGYVSPDNTYVAIEQTKKATDGWVTAQTNRAPVVGHLKAGGRVWQKYLRNQKVQRSLVHRAQGPNELTTIITGTGTFEELTTFADHLEVAVPSS